MAASEQLYAQWPPLQYELHVVTECALYFACAHPLNQIAVSVQSLVSIQVSGEQNSSATLVENDAEDLCGCGLQANSSIVRPVGKGRRDEECSYQAWQLSLEQGQNKFSLAFKTVGWGACSVAA